VRPALPARWRRPCWATVCGAFGGAAIIHSDGVDFNLLEPTALAIAMFIAIPAGGGWLTAYFIERWEPWWAKDRHKTAIASLAVVPVVVAGVGVVPGTVIAAIAVTALLAQIGRLRTFAGHVVLRGAVLVGLAVVTVIALVHLTDDVRTLL